MHVWCGIFNFEAIYDTITNSYGTIMMCLFNVVINANMIILMSSNVQQINDCHFLVFSPNNVKVYINLINSISSNYHNKNATTNNLCWTSTSNVHMIMTTVFIIMFINCDFNFFLDCCKVVRIFYELKHIME